MKERVLGKDLNVSPIGLGCIEGSLSHLGVDYVDLYYQHRIDPDTEPEEVADATPAQISLAWMLAKKPYIVPIPGSRKTQRIRENFGAADVSLSGEEVRSIDDNLNNMEMSAVFGGSPVKK